jgi:D-glycero-alpha-D-manno-heptose-7-phosphate kinase
MILAKAPMRVSFFGGGSDIPSHYNLWGGATLSMGIDKYVYVAVSHTPHNHIKVSYAKQETVTHVDDLQNEIIRNALKYFNITSNIEINSFADITTIGTGLGGSSAFTCALVSALSEYCGQELNEYDTAELACHIEIVMCGWNIGKQDQYASAFGGMNYIKYPAQTTRESITVQRIHPQSIDKYMILIPTDTARHATQILNKIDMRDSSPWLQVLTDIAKEYSCIQPELYSYAEKLNVAWHLKKKMSGDITSPDIDALYSKCLNNGANGAKLLGAGGGGYMLALTKDKQRLRDAFPEKVCHDVKIAREGAKVVYRD